MKKKYKTKFPVVSEYDIQRYNDQKDEEKGNCNMCVSIRMVFW